MNIKEVYDALNAIRDMAEQHSDADGNIEVDEVRVRVALQFCTGELQKAFEKGRVKLPD